MSKTKTAAMFLLVQDRLPILMVADWARPSKIWSRPRKSGSQAGKTE